MKFHSSYFLFMALALTSCLDKTDVEQLYDETYSPQFITDDHTTPTITTTATSASFSPSVRYEAKIRQIYCTIGQDADSVGRRLGRTFVMLTEGERKPIGELFIDSLQPQTHYYCNVVIQDPSGRLYPGMSRDFETLPFEMTLNEPLIKQLYIRYANVGRNSKIGYSIGYRPDLADAISCHKPAIDRYYVDATRFDYQVDLSSMLPNVTLYVQP